MVYLANTPGLQPGANGSNPLSSTNNMLKEIKLKAKNSFIGSWQIQDPSVSDGLVNYFEANPMWQFIGKVGNGINTPIKDSTDIEVDPFSPEGAEYVKHLQECVNRYVKKYEHAGGTGPWTLDCLNMQKYNPGQAFYPFHCERSNNNERMAYRHLAYMTYLNDVSDEGETEYLYQNLKVTPKKGLTLLWPVDWTHTHRGIPSMTETKYIVTGWFSFCSMDRFQNKSFTRGTPTA